MARPLRIEYAGALYHITARGNGRAKIYLDDADRIEFLRLMETAVTRYDWYCHTYCLMDNHYHLLIETGDANLSKGMKYLNGSYTQYFNRRHKRVGHVFQGRYKGILVEKEAYLLELARYIVLNPVRARMLHLPEEWPWSSYRATAGLTMAHGCLTTDWILAGFGECREHAQARYCEFIAEGKGQPSPWQELKNQVYLGSDAFVEESQCKMQPEQSLKGIPKLQKSGPPKPLSYYADQHPEKRMAMAQAYLSGHYTLEQIGEHFGVSYGTVGRAVKYVERDSKM